MKRSLLIMLSAAMTMTSGCASFVNSVQREIKSQAQEAHLDFLLSKDGQVAYGICLKQPKGECPSHAAAGQALGYASTTSSVRELLGPEAISKASIRGGLYTVAGNPVSAQTFAIANNLSEVGVKNVQEGAYTRLKGLLVFDPDTLLANEYKAHVKQIKTFDLTSDDASDELAKYASTAIVSPATDTMVTLYNVATGYNDVNKNGMGVRLSAAQGGIVPGEITISRDDLNASREALGRAIAVEGWRPFILHSIQMFVQLRLDKRIAALGESEIAEKEKAIAETINKAHYIETYLRAYFSEGRFLEVTVDVKEAKNQLSDAVAKATDDIAATLGVKTNCANEKDGDKKKVCAKAKEFAEKLISDSKGKISQLKDGEKYTLVAKDTGAGFVARGGSAYSYKFPGISFQVTLLRKEEPITVSKPDFSLVSSDIVRVFFEAIGDSIAQLPADAKATGCKSVLSNGKTLLECFEAKPGKVTESQFAKVNERADKVETTTATAVGEAIRGLGWVSLNNEMLAKAIETSVGVIARKATEKITWCAYQCGNAWSKQDTSALGLAPTELRTLKITIK